MLLEFVAQAVIYIVTVRVHATCSMIDRSCDILARENGQAKNCLDITYVFRT